MKKQFFLLVAFAYVTTTISAQSDINGGTFWNPNPQNYEVKQTLK